MPPKRKTAAAPKATPKPRRSKLAKDNDLSAEDEREIEEAWSLCREDAVEGWEEEKKGVVATPNIKTVMRALGVEPKSLREMDEITDILDPDQDGYVTYAHFVELAAIHINNKSEETKSEEVERAYRLFTKGSDRPITIHDLRQIAKVLQQDVHDDVLKAMISEANDGAGIANGVDVNQFRSIMSRAGVFT